MRKRRDLKQFIGLTLPSFVKAKWRKRKEKLANHKRRSCKYATFVNKQNIDWSALEYMCSETKRDRVLEKALIREFQLDQNTNGIKYYYNRIDLDGDGRLELFVYIVGSYLCGTGGCSAAIFKEKRGDYVLVSRFSLVNNPVIISDNKTNGYHDIIMNVYGGGIEPFFAQLRYDGKTYPGNPSMQSRLEPGSVIRGKAVVADDIGDSPGIILS
ncbi:hypothetical protein LCM10_05510 [Rossellomorea aquimaris]|uniref:hypothetical protein n=1 Tax=Rossellomorea aquimaris TaxID=189382 RepID=UPI001CD3AB41|nr:hypothetical protein [Rossellomorea aquimaris]MCA1054435.1 hypothetical protein [Rossellomorea aquimaris]